MPKKNGELVIRYGFIRFLYIATICMGTSTGLLILLAPNAARYVIGIPFVLPEQEPIVFGLVGAFWLSVALTSVLGLRAPLKFLPLFLLQLVYKTSWYLLVFIPLAVVGEFPKYGIAVAVGNAVWIAMDLRAIPFRYLLSKDSVDVPVCEAGSSLFVATPSFEGPVDA